MFWWVQNGAPRVEGLRTAYVVRESSEKCQYHGALEIGLGTPKKVAKNDQKLVDYSGSWWMFRWILDF